MVVCGGYIISNYQVLGSHDGNWADNHPLGGKWLNTLEKSRYVVLEFFFKVKIELSHLTTHHTTLWFLALNLQPLPLPYSSVQCLSNPSTCHSPLPHPSLWVLISPHCQDHQEYEGKPSLCLSLQRADRSAATACDIFFFHCRFEKNGQKLRETKKEWIKWNAF